MKRALLIAGAGVVVLAIVVALSGPLPARLGVQGLFDVELSSGHVRLVRATAAAAALPPLAAPDGDALPVIIDSDMAPDDWMAILYLLQQPEVEVKAITVAGTGEAHCGPGVQNARNLAALAGRGAIPVACGRETPLQGEHAFPAEWREAVDGLLGLSLPANPAPPYEGSAVELLTRVIEESPERVQLLTLGPLTNVAEAIEGRPELVRNLSGITLMGGAVGVPGNVRASSDVGNDWAEWNVYVDPHALAVVLGSGAPVSLVPLDATRDVPVTMGFVKKLKRDRGTPAAEFVYGVLTQQESRIRGGGLSFWDPLAAAVVVDGTLAKWAEMSLSVIEEEGPQSGRTVADETGALVRVAQGADAAHFEASFLEALNGRAP